MHGQADDLHVGQLFKNLAGRFDPVQFGHGHIHDDHVGRVGQSEFDRGAPVAGVGDDLDVRLFPRSKVKVCTKVLPFVPLGQRRGGFLKKRASALLKLPFKPFYSYHF